MAAPPPAIAAVDAERPRSLFGLGEGDSDERQRRRGHHCGERTLKGARTEQHRRILCEPSEGGRTGETEKADHEHSLAAEVVGDPATEQQQPAERQRVGGEDPLAVRYRDARGPAGPKEWRWSPPRRRGRSSAVRRR